MPYPRRLLHDDEQVILDLLPHWIRLVFPVTFSMAVAATVGYGYFAWKSAPTWFGIALGVVTMLIAIYLLASVLSWRATLLVLTSSRVIYRTGVVRRVGREIPIDRVQDVTYVQRIIERLFGAGSLIVESAGERGAEPFPDIRHPEIVQSEINRAVDANRRQPPTPSVDSSAGVAAEIAELDILHRRGVLTDAEFAEKKRDLLDRL